MKDLLADPARIEKRRKNSNNKTPWNRKPTKPDRKNPGNAEVRP